MGYNALLRQDEASIFAVSVQKAAKDGDSNKDKEEEDGFALEVRGLRAGGSALDKAAIRCIMQEAKKGGEEGEVRRVGETDVVLYREVNTFFFVPSSFICIFVFFNVGDSRPLLLGDPEPLLRERLPQLGFQRKQERAHKPPTHGLQVIYQSLLCTVRKPKNQTGFYIFGTGPHYHQRQLCSWPT